MLYVNQKNPYQKETKWQERNVRLTECCVLTVGGCACEIEGPQLSYGFSMNVLILKISCRLMLAEASVFFKDIDTNDTPLFLLQKK